MIVNSLYIDPDFIAAEYLRRCCQKKWKKSNDKEALKCWNLELTLEADRKQTSSQYAYSEWY
jgi:hypothetical protein